MCQRLNAGEGKETAIAELVGILCQLVVYDQAWQRKFKIEREREGHALVISSFVGYSNMCESKQ